MKKKENKNHFFIQILFVVYLTFLFYLLFFSETYGRTMENGYRYNLEFFKEIKRFWNNRDSLGWNSVVNLAGNILAFMPFGFFVPILFRIGRNIISCVLLSGIFSFIIETVQLMTQVGAFDVDDILLNAIGGLVGFFCYIVFWKPHQRKKVK